MNVRVWDFVAGDDDTNSITGESITLGDTNNARDRK